MTNLRRRLRKLESQLTDANGLVPHSKEWFDYWNGKIDQVIAGEKDVDLSGMTLEVTDAIIETARRENSHEAGDQETSYPDRPAALVAERK